MYVYNGTLIFAYQQVVEYSTFICLFYLNFPSFFAGFRGGWYLVDAYDPEGNSQYIQTRTGLPLPYANWGPGEPSSRADKCVYSVNAWNDKPCEVNCPVVCEYDFV